MAYSVQSISVRSSGEANASLLGGEAAVGSDGDRVSKPDIRSPQPTNERRTRQTGRERHARIGHPSDGGSGKKADLT
jgi:hypothetical protein